MAKGVSITYGDVAPEAKENFGIDVSEKKFDTIGNLQKYNMQLNDYANPCELYQTVLDGTAVALPSDPTTANIGLWSEQLSNDDGTFTTPITVTLTSEGQYSSQGFTFTFDKFNEIYPTRLTIQWFRVTSEGIDDLSGVKEFTPSSAFCFCRNQVENFNKVIIKFYALNMPKNRLKLEVIDYGYGTVFYGDELRNVKISQSIDPISTEIKINTCDFTLDSHTDMVYSFQAKQPLTVRFNDRLMATMFVKSSKRKAKFLWDINAEDYINILDSTPFVGGMYASASAFSIIDDIFTVAKVPYIICDGVTDDKLTGYISYTTCREALMQVCFALGVAVDTTDENDIGKVCIKSLVDDVTQTIPLSRIMTGQSFEAGSTVTRVTLTVHSYTPIEVSKDNRVALYNAEESGVGENILVKFTEPMHDVYIVNEGKIVELGVNYAIINADTTNFRLIGYGYEHTEHEEYIDNSKVLASETENVQSITNATLISSSNAKRILERCFAWLSRVETMSEKIIEGKDISREYRPITWGECVWGECAWGGTIPIDTVIEHQPIHLGDVITSETSYLGDVTGRVVQQSFNLNGNIIVKEVVVK